MKRETPWGPDGLGMDVALACHRADNLDSSSIQLSPDHGRLRLPLPPRGAEDQSLSPLRAESQLGLARDGE